MEAENPIPYEEFMTLRWADVKRIFTWQFGPTWVFRGQSDGWPLSTSLERLELYPDPPVTSGHWLAPDGFEERQIGRDFHERQILKEFQRRAHHYLDSTKIPASPDDLLEWWALMQHHGAPTRLLDCTYSPYVAAFFALEAPGLNHSNAVIIAFDAQWCADAAWRNLRNLPGGVEVPDGYEPWPPALANAVFRESQRSFVTPLVPFRMNERMSAQQGLFLVPGTITESFEANLRANGPDLKGHVKIIYMPKSMRQEALYDLHTMNINRATLFPGLDGFAASLRLMPYLHIMSAWDARRGHFIRYTW